MKYKFFYLIFTALASQGLSQHQFTEADTIRGSVTPERAWWDLTYYHLDIKIDILNKSISGSNLIAFKVLDSSSRIMQIDLQEPLDISKIEYRDACLKYERNGSAYFFELGDDLEVGEQAEVKVYYSGHLVIANNPPWSGGLTYKKDGQGKDWIVTSCQGIGASIWWPCKDHYYDEVDSMLISVTVPKGLMNVSNGKLRSVDEIEDELKYNWFVSNPINNYGVNMNIADYALFSENYNGLNGRLNCSYYVLKENLNKAKSHFKQVPLMLEAFEYWFGPYPFYEDGFKLVEVPYAGMEHQSSVTYGNGYENGYLGRDVSNTGLGFLFDFIIIHEAGHEWFANSVTAKDVADLWIHEGFTAYAENLYLDYHYGKDTASKYVIGTRSKIQNNTPIIGPYGVNARGSVDMYYKGANVLHTLRSWVNDDKLWRQALIGIQSKFRHQTITEDELEQYLREKLNLDLIPFFDQYLRDVRIPILEYRIFPGGISYRWSNVVSGFNMPIDVYIDEKKYHLKATTNWNRKKLRHKPDYVSVDKNFYVAEMNLTGK